jgi:hypothetical protein
MSYLLRKPVRRQSRAVCYDPVSAPLVTTCGLPECVCVAAAGCLIALIALPSRDRSAGVPAAEDALGDGRRADDGEQPQEHR